nr:hypothetical protein CFP56_16484 [Quercus suber]
MPNSMAAHIRLDEQNLGRRPRSRMSELDNLPRNGNTYLGRCPVVFAHAVTVLLRDPYYACPASPGASPMAQTMEAMDAVLERVAMLSALMILEISRFKSTLVRKQDISSSMHDMPCHAVQEVRIPSSTNSSHGSFRESCDHLNVVPVFGRDIIPHCTRTPEQHRQPVFNAPSVPPPMPDQEQPTSPSSRRHLPRQRPPRHARHHARGLEALGSPSHPTKLPCSEHMQ